MLNGMTSYEEMIKWSQQGKCYRCKQHMEVVYAGLINMTQFMHDKICTVKYNIHSCPHCGKDINM